MKRPKMCHICFRVWDYKQKVCEKCGADIRYSEFNEAYERLRDEIWQVIEPKLMWCLDKILRLLKMMRIV